MKRDCHWHYSDQESFFLFHRAARVNTYNGKWENTMKCYAAHKQEFSKNSAIVFLPRTFSPRSNDDDSWNTQTIFIKSCVHSNLAVIDASSRWFSSDWSQLSMVPFHHSCYAIQRPCWHGKSKVQCPKRTKNCHFGYWTHFSIGNSMK